MSFVVSSYAQVAWVLPYVKYSASGTAVKYAEEYKWITADVNLKTFGERSGTGGDTDDHSSDMQSERGKAYLGSL